MYMSRPDLCPDLQTHILVDCTYPPEYLNGILNLNIPEVSYDISPQICFSIVTSTLFYGNSIHPVTKTKMEY